MELLINIDVDDLERGIGFYEAGLGLRLHRKLFDGTVAEMHGACAPIYLLAKAAGSLATTRSDTRRDYTRPCTWTSWSRRSNPPSNRRLARARNWKTGRRISPGAARPACPIHSAMACALSNGNRADTTRRDRDQPEPASTKNPMVWAMGFFAG